MMELGKEVRAVTVSLPTCCGCRDTDTSWGPDCHRAYKHERSKGFVHLLLSLKQVIKLWNFLHLLGKKKGIREVSVTHIALLSQHRGELACQKELDPIISQTTELSSMENDAQKCYILVIDYA